MPIRLVRIYTRTGDDGTTALGDGSRVHKSDPRLAAYADVDESNAAIGAAIALGGLPADVQSLLRRIQNELFDAGADLCVPVSGAEERLRVTGEYITRLEAACDAYNANLAPLRSFVLPGGTPGAALLHVARTVVRRAERSAWVLLQAEPDATNVLAARYLNRLADLLFILARVANADSGEVLWEPGRSDE